MTKDEALDLALEALENGIDGQTSTEMDKAITAIKQALAAPVQPVQEPVAWMHEWDDGERVPMIRKRDVDSSDIDSPKSVRPLVFGDTAPPAAQPAQQQEPVPDYAWPTVADYEKDVGFEVNDAFKMAWDMARTTNALFIRVEKNT